MSVPTEREAFLLRELVRFLYDEDLVSGKEIRVLVVAAGKRGRNTSGTDSISAKRTGRLSPYLISRFTRTAKSRR